MEILHYVRRKEDGFYYSVDGEFILDKSKAFVFHEGAAMGIGSFLTDEYEVIPLTDEETERFDAICNEEQFLPPQEYERE